MSLEEEFRSKYFVSSVCKCWLWKGGLTWEGYGSFGVKLEGRKRKCGILAHRVSWMLYIGEIPFDAKIGHRCRNRRCVNPKHLVVIGGKKEKCDVDIFEGGEGDIEGEESGDKNGGKGRESGGEVRKKRRKSGTWPIAAEHYAAKQVKFKGVEYGSMRECARAHFVSVQTVRYWVKTGKAELA